VADYPELEGGQGAQEDQMVPAMEMQASRGTVMEEEVAAAVRAATPELEPTTRRLGRRLPLDMLAACFDTIQFATEPKIPGTPFTTKCETKEFTPLSELVYVVPLPDLLQLRIGSLQLTLSWNRKHYWNLHHVYICGNCFVIGI
jgi:hypothetical protein